VQAIFSVFNPLKKYLRVILLPDKETVHNAFLDSNFKRQNHEN